MKWLTDMHTHSTYSFDGRDDLQTMLETAQKKGLAFYGASEHFDYDYDLTYLKSEEAERIKNFNAAAYFHGARHLQEDYQGVMNVIVGAEFGYTDDQTLQKRYLETYETYRPDYVINSVHGVGGKDFALCPITETKAELYGKYLGLIRRSIDAPYPYDIVGHIEYIARYAPYADKSINTREFGEQIDGILTAIIQKDKILEANSSTKTLPQLTLPNEEILRRYYELGGRKISFGSDAHFKERVADKREQIVALLKNIGFTYITVPNKGEHIKVEI